MAAKKRKPSTTILGIPMTRSNVIVTIGAIGTIGAAIVVMPPAWSVARYVAPAWIGYVDGKVEQAQAPVLRSLNDIQEAQAKNRLSVIQDELLKVEIEIAQTKDVAKRAAANLQKNKLMKDQEVQEKILENIARSRTK